MDTRTPKKTVDQQIADIKAHMPAVYAAIKAKADELGRPAFALVRRGLAGLPNQFYAFEGGHVVGTPFVNMPGLSGEAALLMVQFGASYLAMWGEVQTPAQPQEAAHGAH
jgi:hypothetical protein